MLTYDLMSVGSTETPELDDLATYTSSLYSAVKRSGQMKCALLEPHLLLQMRETARASRGHLLVHILIDDAP